MSQPVTQQPVTQPDPYAEFGGSTTPAPTATPSPNTGSDPYAEFGGSVTPPTTGTNAPTTPLNSPDPNARFAVSGVGTISAPEQPKSFMGRYAKWLENVSDDIKYGTDHTGVGSVLKSLGAHGVYRGAPEAVGDFMASLPLGILKSQKGQAELTPQVLGGEKGHTWQGVKDLVGGGLQATQIPAAFVAPEESALSKEGLLSDAANAAGRGVTHVYNEATGTVDAVKNVAKQVVQGEKVAQPGAQSAVREGVQSSVETTNAAADRAAEPIRVHPPEIDPAVRDHARLNPFPGEDIKIKTFPGTPATETEAATNPTARITGPNGSSIELELDGKIARVKGIINSGKPGDGQRLYDNAIAWAKDSGYDTFEGDKVQTEAAKTAWGRVAERHNARMAEEAPHTPSIDLRGSRPAPEVAASDVTPVKTVKLPEATEPLTENSKTTIVDDHLDALEQQKSSAYKRMDDTAGFDVKALKDKLKTDKYNLKQLGSSDPDKAGRLVEAINDSTDRIAEANEKMKAAGIDPDYADALNKRWEAGQDYKASLLKRTNPDGSMNVKGLWDDAKKMRNDPEYGDRLEQWFGSKDAADAYVKALEKAHAEGLRAMKRQAFARQILWRVAGTTAAGAVGLGLYDATH